MSNLRIVFENIADSAALVASSEAGLLVIDNVLTHSKTQVWRSSGTVESITATFASAVINCVSLPICNLSETATLRVRCYTNSADSVPVFDTGALSCCAYTTIDKIDFASGPLNANTFSYGGGTYATLFFDQQTVEKVLIDIDDSANPAGYIECSYLLIGNYFSPQFNADYGMSWQLNDTSKHSRSESGDLMVARGARFKRLAFTLAHLNASDRAQIMNLFIKNGLSSPVFVSFFPESSDEQEKQLYQIYGFLTKLNAMRRYRYSADQNAIEIEER